MLDFALLLALRLLKCLTVVVCLFGLQRTLSATLGLAQLAASLLMLRRLPQTCRTLVYFDLQTTLCCVGRLLYVNEHTVLSPCSPILDFSGIALAHIHLQSHRTSHNLLHRVLIIGVYLKHVGFWYTFSRIGLPQLATSFVHASPSISNM